MVSAGLSVDAIAARAGLHSSTISYWLAKFGLRTARAAHHTPRGGLSREQLETLVGRDLTVRQIAEEVDRGAATVRYWLRVYDLKTTSAARRQARVEMGTAPRALGHCPRHGIVTFVRSGTRSAKCVHCRAEAVSEWRRRAKRRLVAEAGGRCVTCGYDRHIGALEFHHVDPSAKAFPISGRGLALAFDRLRAEAAKCVLLCANCHAEVEAGVAMLPLSTPPPRVVKEALLPPS